MLQKFLTYIKLWLLFQLLVEINCQTFKPVQRADHTATLIDNKLYILSGTDLITFNDTKDFFYLDASTSFNTQDILWNDLSSINTVPAHSDATSVKGGANNSTLFLYGGISNVTMAPVYTFDPQSNSWMIPIITGNPPFPGIDDTGIIDYNGKMYILGDSNMVIIDTINLSWGNGSISGAPN